MIAQLLFGMFQKWLTRKSYEVGAKGGFSIALKSASSDLGPGGEEFAKARFRELLQQGTASGRASAQALSEAQVRFPPRQ